MGVPLYHMAAGPILAAALLGQVTQPAAGTVRGQVVDARTGTPLVDVRVRVDESAQAVVTGAEGRFELRQVPPGRHTLHLSVVGFILVRRDIEVAPGAVVELTIPLAEGAGTYTEELIVRAPPITQPEPGVAVQQVLRGTELQDLRGVLADDPMRAVQTLPGVAADDDLHAEFVVRGSAFDHIGVSLDGVATPVLLHTVRGVEDTGSIMMINSDILDQATLFSGSYPQRMGDRTGAWLAFGMRDGSRERTVVRGAVSGTNASAVIEGPLGRARKGSWLFSIRQSYLDWIIHRVEPEATGVFGFTDLQARLVYDLSDRQQVQASIVAGRSHYVDREEDTPNGVEDGLNRAGLLTLAWRAVVGGSAVVTQRVWAVASDFYNDNPWEQSLADGRTRELGYRADLSYSLAPGVSLEGGAAIQSVSDEQHLRQYTRLHPDAVPVPRSHEAYAGDTTRPSAYVLARWTPRPRITLAPGLRVDRSTLVGDATASPWMQAECPLGPSLALRAGAGLYQQFPAIDQVTGPHGGGTALMPERAWHMDVGLERPFGSTSRVRVAFYDREERDFLRLPGSEYRLVNGKLVPPNPAGRYVNALDGRARGMEVLMQRSTPNGLSGWFSYALSDTRYTDRRTGEQFSGDFDQRHTINAYARYRFSNRLSVAGRFRHGSNFPLAGYFEERDGRYFVSDQRNTTRLPVYARLDLRASRTFDFTRRRLTLFVEVLNVLNRTNYGPADGSIRRPSNEAVGYLRDLFPIIPSAGILIEF